MDDEEIKRRIEEYFSDDKNRLTVTFRKIVSDKGVKARIGVADDIYAPESADPEFPVTEHARDTFKYLLAFRGDKTVDVFERFPHMANILSEDKVERVPKHLRDLWEELDVTKKAAYRGLSNVVQNIHWVSSVAGAGKSDLTKFITLMAKFGDPEGTEHKVNSILFAEQNATADKLANQLDEAIVAMGKGHRVIRLFAMETELDDLTSILMASRKDAAEAEAAARADHGTGTQFTFLDRVRQFARDAEKSKAQKSKAASLSLHRAAHDFYLEHPNDFPQLRKVLEQINDGATVDDKKSEVRKAVIRQLAARVCKEFLTQFDGIIAATPYAGCHRDFVRQFKADICVIDEGARIHELDFVMVLRYHSPKLIVVVGDTTQTGPFAHPGRTYPGGPVTNPFVNYVRTSTLERAMHISPTVREHLTLNHRGHGGLVRLPSRLFYYGTMMPAKEGLAAWPDETKAWHQFLKKRCPALKEGNQRILVELQGATVQNTGAARVNMDHVKYVCDVAVDALKDGTLRGLNGNKKEILIISFYKAQVESYNRELDQRVRNGVLTPRQRKQIEVCTVDTAQDTEGDLVIVDFVRTRHPGTTCDRRRLCVALTRARQAEIVMMPRSIFADFKYKIKELPHGQDPRLLEAIYKDIAAYDGIVRMDVAKARRDRILGERWWRR